MALLEPSKFSDRYAPLNVTGEYKPCTKEEALSGELGRPVRVYTDGVFDLFHSGHARQYMQCKNMFPNVYLIVGVCNDETTNLLKGPTVNTEAERYSNVSHCRYIDEVVKNAPWVPDDKFMVDHHIDFVTHDAAPYVNAIGGVEGDDLYKPFKDAGQFMATERTHGVSTSELITRIIRNRHQLIKRNMSRGVSTEEMNITEEYALQETGS